MDLRKRVPDGGMVFGGRNNLERRQKGLTEPEAWRTARLRPLTIRGDKTQAGNRQFRLAPDGRTCTFTMLQDHVSNAGPHAIYWDDLGPP